MEKILNGVVGFHSSLNETVRPLFAKLVQEGQSPRALFITCADSRIVPNQITTTDPGDLFLIRNIGNLIPTYERVLAGHADTSVAAAIEYSLGTLNIPNIIICGHTDCGAMKAVMRFRSLPEGSPLRSWMSNAEEALTELMEGHAMDDTLSSQNQLAQLNVLQQLMHLQTYPMVQERLQAGTLKAYGWFLDIEKPEVLIYHPGRNRFVRIDEEVINELRFLNQVFDKTPGIRLNIYNVDSIETTGSQQRRSEETAANPPSLSSRKHAASKAAPSEENKEVVDLQLGKAAE